MFKNLASSASSASSRDGRASPSVGVGGEALILVVGGSEGDSVVCEEEAVLCQNQPISVEVDRHLLLLEM